MACFDDEVGDDFVEDAQRFWEGCVHAPFGRGWVRGIGGGVGGEVAVGGGECGGGGGADVCG